LSSKRVSKHEIAYKADPSSDEAKLKVRFLVPPLLQFIPVLGDYWILYLDQDYQYALIGGHTKLSTFNFSCYIVLWWRDLCSTSILKIFDTTSIYRIIFN